MKALLAAFLFLSLGSTAQVLPLLEDHKVWQMVGVYFFERPTQYITMKIGKDSSFGTFSHKELLQCVNAGGPCEIFTRGGWLREDSLNRVYFRANGLLVDNCYDLQENLIYDFRLRLGDTVPNFDTIYFRYKKITSFDTILDNGVNRRRWVYRTTISEDTILEGIGSLSGLMFPMWCTFENYYSLVRVINDGDTIYERPDRSIGISELANPEIKIYPNPSEDILNISSEADEYDLTITNALGQPVFKRTKLLKKETKIPVQEWPSGLYYLNISSKGSMSTKILEVLH